jgi:hypothetical protein
MDRRSFLLKSAAAAGALRARHLLATHDDSPAQPGTGVQHETPFGASGRMIPDDGWRMWPDREAKWESDAIYLPEDTHL